MQAPELTRETADRFWQELVDGHWNLEREYRSDGRCYGVFSRRSAEAAELYRLPAARLAVLERMIDGHSQKVIAIDLNRSNSSIAVTLADCRRRLGVECRTSAFPLILALTALASRSELPLLWSHAPDACEHGLRVVSLPRPDTTKLAGITPAEAEVLALWLEGRSQDEIAAIRHARRRTVVNQLAAVRRKLAISGRMQLLQWLLLFEERDRPAPVEVAKAPPARPRPVLQKRLRRAFESSPLSP